MAKVLPALLAAAKKAGKVISDPASAEKLAAIEQLAKKYGTKGIPDKINTMGKGMAELRDEQRLLEKAEITPYDKRMQFLQQAFNRKLPAAAGVIGGAGLMAQGNEAAASEVEEAAPMGVARAEELNKPAERHAKFERMKKDMRDYAEQLPEAIAMGANLPMGIGGAIAGEAVEAAAPMIKDKFGRLKAAMGK